MNTGAVKLKRATTRMPLALRIAACLMLLVVTMLMTQPASAGNVNGAQEAKSGPDKHANFTGTVHAYIPFAFSVRGKTMEAGDYYVSRFGEKFIAIADATGKNTVLASTEETDSPSGRANPKLVFHRYGDTYFLAETWLTYSNVGHELPASNEERALAKQLRQMQETLDLGK